jgi:hypothetical protein
MLQHRVAVGFVHRLAYSVPERKTGLKGHSIDWATLVLRYGG